MTPMRRHILLLALLVSLFSNATSAQQRAVNSPATQGAAEEFCGNPSAPKPAFLCPATSAKVCLCYLKASKPGGEQAAASVQDAQLLESNPDKVRVRRPRSTPRLLPQPFVATLSSSDAGSVPTPPPRF